MFDWDSSDKSFLCSTENNRCDVTTFNERIAAISDRLKLSEAS